MCTSFAVYSARPLYGMNFDFPPVALRLRLAPGQRGRVFYLGFEWHGQVHEFAGMNASGLFACAQILVAHFEIAPQPGDVLVSPAEVFRRSLRTGERAGDTLAILGARRLGYTSARKGHQLYADRFGDACVLEPGQDGNLVYRRTDPFTILANRPLQKEWENLERADGRTRIDRFRTAHRLIGAKFDRFSIEDGFEVLERTNLVAGRFTTQSSMVCDPQEGAIYLALRRDFERIWKISLREGTVETFSGFDRSWNLPLAGAGITEAQLLEPVAARGRLQTK